MGSMKTETDSRSGTLLKVADVAAALRVHVRTVRRWVRTGQLTAARVGKSYYIRVQDLQTFIESRTIKGGEHGID